MKTATKTITNPLTPAEMKSISPHPGWSDGRKGFMWTRFDAIIDEPRFLRAEITFDDDSDISILAGEPTVYFDPRLRLESNRPTVHSGWQTVSSVEFPISRQDVFVIASADPKDLVTRYSEEIAKLTIWSA